MNRKLLSIIKLIPLIIVIFFTAMLVLVGVSIMLAPVDNKYGPTAEGFFLDGLSKNIIFTQNPIELIEYRRDRNQILLKGHTQTNCHSYKENYLCNVKTFFTLNKYGYLAAINLMIFDPYKKQYFLVSITDINANGRNSNKAREYHEHVKVTVREVEELIADREIARNSIHSNENSIGATDNKYNLEGTLSIYQDELRNGGVLESTLDIRYKSQGIIKTKKISLNGKNRVRI
jgi:hypothetical protein